VSLSWESGYSESLNHTSGSVSSCDSNGVNHIIVLEDLSNHNFFIKVIGSEVDFLLNRSTVNLDFEEVGFSLSEVELGELGHGQDSDYCAVLLYSFQVSLDGFLGFVVFFPSLGVLCEGLLL